MNTLPEIIIDPHQHFFSANEVFPFDYMPSDYLNDASPLDHKIRATVFVECSTHYDVSLPTALQATGETRFVAAIGEEYAGGSTQLAAAIVGFADPFAEDVPFADILDAQIAAGSGRLRGIRRMVAWDGDETLNYPSINTRAFMLSDPRLRPALHALVDRDLIFETWVYHPQLGELVELAHAEPSCQIILDHAGTPLSQGRYAGEDNVWIDWSEAMARLAGEKNVHVKIGGLAMAGSPLDPVREKYTLERWTVPVLAEALTPYLDHLIRHFGAERCIFESNFPVDKGCCDLSVLVEAYSQALAGLDDASRAAVFAGNAAKIYGIELGKA